MVKGKDKAPANRGFPKLATVKATKTFGAICAASGCRITIAENTIGMIDEDNSVSDGDTQFVHFPVGRATPCVSFPVAHMNLV